MSPRFSVIIPCYNGEEFIPAAIRSALDQTAPDLEVVVVDDGSTDRSAGVVRSFMTDPRVRLVQQENRGLGGARNAGLSAACGDYVNFLDADDLLEPTKLAVQGRLLDENSDVAMVLCDGWVIDRQGEIIGDYLVAPQRLAGVGRLFEALFMGGFFPPLVPLLRRVVALRVGGFSEQRDTMAWADTGFWMRVSQVHPGFRFVPERLCRYRRHGSSMSADRNVMERAACGTYASLMRDLAPDCARALRFVQRRLVDREMMAAGWRFLAHKRNTGKYGIRAQALRQTLIQICPPAAGPGLAPTRQVLVWGAGSGGVRILKIIEAYRRRIDGFVDSNPAKVGTLIEGVPVLAGDRVVDGSAARSYVIVASTYATEIVARLAAAGWEEFADFCMVDFDDVSRLEVELSASATAEAVTAVAPRDCEVPVAVRDTALRLAAHLIARGTARLGIYGAGASAGVLIGALAERGIRPCVVVDANRRFWGRPVSGLNFDCEPPVVLLQSECDCIAIAAHAYVAEIRETLQWMFADAVRPCPAILPER